jgi:hypothetical protein
MNRWLGTLVLVLVIGGAGVLPGLQGLDNQACAQDAGKIKITKLDDLPKHTYPVAGSLTDLVNSETKIMELAAKREADIRADLAKYDIADRTTLQGMHSSLLSIRWLHGDNAGALAQVEKVRELEGKEAKRLTTGLFLECYVAAQKEAGSTQGEKFRSVLREQLTKRIAALPWKTVQDEIENTKGRLEIFSESLIQGIISARMQPVVNQTGELNSDMADGLISMHLLMTRQLPLKDIALAVYGDAIDRHKEHKPDIWAARAVNLNANDNLNEVLVAAWDSGSDPQIFAKQLWTNQAEPINGKDDDHNGYVDDRHGIAYDFHAKRTTGELVPLGEAEGRMPTVMQYMKGFMDVQAAVDSKEASELKRHLSSLSPEGVRGFLEDLSLAGNYAHGTHVAGLMLEGNPFAKLLVARHTYDHHLVPVARTIEWGTRDAAKCLDTVAYLKDKSVRVVNMSWGEAQQDAEDSLEANGIGANAEERRELARKVFGLQKDGLYSAISGAPDILFICAAGNADNDVEFDAYIPSSFDLPNLLVVGAVDQAGDPTSFTSFGRTVQVYASGFEVDSYVPGGQRMKMSGTSMASPNVANLAAKILAIKPGLKPAEVIELIKKGSDRRKDGEHEFLLINPKRTIEQLKPATPHS